MKLETPDGYRIERKDTLPDLLSGDPFVAGRIGGDPANLLLSPILGQEPARPRPRAKIPCQRSGHSGVMTGGR
jgi:hypothetical protein